MFNSGDHWLGIERKLIEQVREKVTKSKDFDINKTEDSGTSLLHLCCQTGMATLCKLLIDYKADINIQDAYKMSPLMIAAHNSFQNIVEILLSNGAELELSDINGFNALMHAVHANDVNIYKILCAVHKIDSTTNSYLGKMTSLALASSLGNVEIAKVIVASELNCTNIVNEKVEKTGMTPLMLAICGNQTEMVELLISNGAELQITSSASLSSLAYARKLGYPLLKLDIPSITIETEVKDGPLKKKFHPLTPNLYLSPIKIAASPKRAIEWIKLTVKEKRRSRSVETKKNEVIVDEGSQDEDLLKTILQLSKMEQYWQSFLNQEALSADDMIETLLSKKEIFRMKKNPAPTTSSQSNCPSWIYPGHEPALYKRVWDIVVTPTGFADTPKLTSLLLTSRLPTDVLGYIWSLSNLSLAPALSQLETYTSLALIALVQNGYSFTSAAVLNTIKEAPLPKLDYPLVEGQMVTPITMMIKPLNSTFPSLCPVASPSVQSSVIPPSSSLPVADQLFTTFTATKTVETVSSLKTDNESSIQKPNSMVQSTANEFSLLDLNDSPAHSARLKSVHSHPLNLTDSLLERENSIDFTSDEIPADFQAKLNKKDLISEFSPTSSKNKGENTLYSTIPSSNPNVNKSNLLVDDLFGEFQSVNFSSTTSNTVNDEEEFDDFKSADFTPFTLLEVKEKPPEDDRVEKASLTTEVNKQVHDKSGIEDLFPRCVLKVKEEEEGDLITAGEDKYSALRGLTASEDNDEFGDFLAAAPPQPTSIPIPFSTGQNNIQERAMEACLDILQEAVRIFESITKEDVLKQVVTDPRGIQYLEELIEVERIALRLRNNLDKEDFKIKLQKLSSCLETYLKPHRNSYMVEENGPKCGICLCERGPAYVKYGINNFHAPCANLYLHKVDSNLPIAPVM